MLLKSAIAPIRHLWVSCRVSVRPELERETQQSKAVFKKAIRKKDICKNGIRKKERDRGK
jgi:hypothetical protein